MKKIMKKIVSVTGIMILILSCRGPRGPEGPQGPQGPEGPTNIYVMSFLFSSIDTSIAEAYVSFSPSIPNVKINNINIPFWEVWRNTFYFYKRGITTILPGSDANLEVTYIKADNSQGEANASVKVPGIFAITSHDTSQPVSIPLGSSFTVTWSSSQNANFYFVSFYLEYMYVDTAGEDKYFYCEKDTMITQNFIIFPSSFLFPNLNEIDSIMWSWGWFEVDAVSGPQIKEGEKGNVTGDGFGFFWGIIYGGVLGLYVEGGKFISRKETQSYEKLKEFLKNKAEKIR